MPQKSINKKVSRRGIPLHELQIGLHHVLDEGVEVKLGLPPQDALRLGRVSHELLHLGGAVILRVDLHSHNVRALLAADLLVAAAAPLDLLPHESEGGLDELPDRVHLTGGNHEVVGLLQL